MMPIIIGIIPARGGSKGIKRKNIRPLAGKPLIAWSIEVALSCKGLDQVIVSTEDEEIAETAENYGAEVPFLRPPELARDDTPDWPVFEHAVNWLVQNKSMQPDIAVWLRPTTPLRTREDVESAVNLLTKQNMDCVRSVCPVEHHPYWMKTLNDGILFPFIEEMDENTFYQRQSLPELYRLNGAVDVINCKSAREQSRLFGGVMGGYPMPFERSIDIDTDLDFAVAELLFKRRLS